MSETKVNHIVLNEGQAQYLISLSRAAADYRGSWESLAKRGEEETDRLDKGFHLAGPSHQVMAEVQQEFGKLKMAIDLLWSIFRVDTVAEEDREAARKEIDKFLKIATGEPKGLHGTWFSEGQTVSDFS